MGRMIAKGSSNEQYNKVVSIAKNMALESGNWYVVICKGNGAYGFMPEAHYKVDVSGEIVLRLSPLPDNPASYIH